ncbi:TPA: GntR family transcriptional regulator [Klebsiella pneumoniae]|jgi:DNA-binding GntR family transcriptional regulator|uniref:GntR family transcriptional regulator n=1 Tax=Klebsiella pneumoniae TaxID=573 RepID=UPI001E59C5F3|nr:GntR family transcriptional regulator [Klebsiella pneumoniae]ELY5842813.1 GntR family transcriptional regulator [Cronobacter sakazakii]HDT2354222.1 GntR family transcriptional regulator [Klebsiella pneumoniae subsp. pneumoniae]MCC4954957.1 GntR family transcriptional regulator [Klebsiella pneumoniae]MEC4528688.1 GntR family transcriptional regulator [Klebsiella pneumoniae]HBT3579910.1 GntR family transcriptional regulator [Klebsiella pneumoniae]
MTQPKSTLVRVANLLAMDINTGEFQPGSWLKQVELAERYHCPRSEVRRALDQLVIERLVQHVPNRGYHVYTPNEEQRRNISAIRAILESASAEDIVEHIQSHQLDTLRQCAEMFDHNTQYGTILQQYESNLAFHRALLAPCSNMDMIELIFELRSRVPSAALGQWNSHARIVQSSEEHFAMVTAIEHQDSALLAQLMRQHILQEDNPRRRI